MTLYHGSDTAINVPMILPPSRLLDFGEGFYTTSSYEQAKSWAQRVRMRRNSKNEIISIFYATIQLFETGLLSEAETITRLKVEKIYDQILFHTERALKFLSYVKMENLDEDPNGT